MAAWLVNYYQAAILQELTRLADNSLFQSFTLVVLNLCHQIKVELFVAGPLEGNLTLELAGPSWPMLG
jgi:hypothetical protein